MSGRAPVAIFAYRRAEHLRRTLESLCNCLDFSDWPLYVFADGAKGATDAEDVSAARSVAREVLGERAEYRLSAVNRGLSASILGGTATVLERHDRVIVIEDDLDLSPGFLRYMNSALQRYEEEPRVLQVSGHMFEVPEFRAATGAVPAVDDVVGLGHLAARLATLRCRGLRMGGTCAGLEFAATIQHRRRLRLRAHARTPDDWHRRFLGDSLVLVGLP